MDNTVLVLLVVALAAGGLFVFWQVQQQRAAAVSLTTGQQIGAGVGQALGGILQAVGV